MRARTAIFGFAAVAAAVGVARRLLRRNAGAEAVEEDPMPAAQRTLIDEAGVESFPASDPPSWTLGEERGS
jgi:hypothetical protein